MLRSSKGYEDDEMARYRGVGASDVARGTLSSVSLRRKGDADGLDGPDAASGGGHAHAALFSDKRHSSAGGYGAAPGASSGGYGGDFAGYAKADFMQSTINLVRACAHVRSICHACVPMSSCPACMPTAAGTKALAPTSRPPRMPACTRMPRRAQVTCVLGAGALGWPFCFKACGLLLATLIMCVTLVATRVSYQLLLHCAQLCGRKSYEGIAAAALGRPGRACVEACIAALNLGALVAFLDILADVLSAVAGTLIPPGAEPSRHAYIVGVTLGGALPVTLLVRDHALIAAL